MNVRAAYSGDPRATTPLLDAVVRFGDALRGAGVPVSLVEVTDAVRAVGCVDLASREEVRTALGTTLVKRAEDRAIFERLFELAFVGPGRPAAEDAGGPLDEAALQAALDRALADGDPEALRALAALAVGAFADIDGLPSASERYFLTRVLRRLDLSALLQRALRLAAADDDRSELQRHLDAEEQRRRLEEFRKILATEVRIRLAEARADDPLLGLERRLDAPELAFVEASRTELAAMREAVRPLARRLAARLAKRRRSEGRGRLDVRRTIRRGLSYGGVPVDIALRRPKTHRSDLVVLCDVSGSVAEFARFLLTLLHAVHQELPRIRSFAFVDGVDEVTRFLEDSPGVLDVHHLLGRTAVVADFGHSDYGAVLDRFLGRFDDALLPTTTVVIAGDARNNYRDANAAALRTLRSSVRRLYWFNPEPAAQWNTTDSVMAQYAPACDTVFEVRNLRQLESAVYRIT